MSVSRSGQPIPDCPIREFVRLFVAYRKLENYGLMDAIVDARREVVVFGCCFIYLIIRFVSIKTGRLIIFGLIWIIVTLVLLWDINYHRFLYSLSDLVASAERRNHRLSYFLSEFKDDWYFLITFIVVITLFIALLNDLRKRKLERKMESTHDSTGIPSR